MSRGISTSTVQDDTVELTTKRPALLSISSPKRRPGGARRAIASLLLSSTVSAQPAGSTIWSRRSWSCRVSKAVSSRKAVFPSRWAGTAMATKGSLAIGPGNMSPTAGKPVLIAVGAAALPLGVGSMGSGEPKGTRVLNSMRISKLAKMTWLPKLWRNPWAS